MARRKGIMLKLKDLFENFELAKNCIQNYDHDPDSLNETLGWFRISSNAVYPFRQKERLCFLRLCPAAEKALCDVESEVDVIAWLRAQGFPTMEPVPMKDGRLSGLLATPWGDYVVSCFGQVAGRSLEGSPATPALIEGYGRCLGQLHSLLERCPHAGRRQDHRALLARAAQRLEQYAAPDGVRKACDRLYTQLEQLPVSPAGYGLVHYDFEPYNVFYDAQTDRFAVIDFDDMIRCWYGLDVVRALDSLSDVGSDTDTPCQQLAGDPAALFLRGYRSVRPFAAAEEKALPLMRRLVQLVEYTGLLHVLAEEIPDPPQWMVQLRRRLEGKKQWLEGQLED